MEGPGTFTTLLLLAVVVLLWLVALVCACLPLFATICHCLPPLLLPEHASYTDTHFVPLHHHSPPPLTTHSPHFRGLAHVGVYEAMVESGVPVDVVGGTSQGAFVGALIAMIHDPKQPNKTRQELIRLCRIFALEMSSNWAKIKDLTFPITSYFNGGVFNSGIMRHFGDLRIEDLWLDYFCISTDITASKGIVHHNGMLWRYVRASMTLGPYLPPMCEVYPGDDDDVRRRHSHLNRRHFTHIVGTCWYLLVLVGTLFLLIIFLNFSSPPPNFFPPHFFSFSRCITWWTEVTSTICRRTK